MCVHVFVKGRGAFENIKSLLYYFNSPLSNKLDMQYEILIGQRPAQQNVYIATLNGVRLLLIQGLYYKLIISHSCVILVLDQHILRGILV